MAQLDALSTLAAVRARLIDLSLDECFVRDPALTQVCKSLWQGDGGDGGLVSDLWVEAAFPATVPQEGPRTLAELVANQQFSKRLADHLDTRGNACPSDRVLYTHQRDAILLSAPEDGRSPGLVVTAGTGAGKTECFLLPILNQLFGQARANEAKPGDAAGGVRCIILYPMNALVNDQVDRLYDWLRGQDMVSLFHFTSETPEDRQRFVRMEKEVWERCRFCTRQHARGLERLQGDRLVTVDTEAGEPRGPVPDILVTNYSMLEYMLCRPQDAVFFGPALEAIVLDEAHLYTGTLAAEITLLMRRMLDRCGRQPEQVLQIATSATLGTRTLRPFAATVFGKDEAMIHVIEGGMRRADLTPDPQAPTPALADFAARRWLQGETLMLSENGVRLVEEPDEARWAALRTDLASLVRPEVAQGAAAAAQRQPARLLLGALRTAPLAAQLEDILYALRRLKVRDLAQRLWGESSDTATAATLELLRMGASARHFPGEYPLIPHRLHLLMRAPDGLCVCINSKCSAPAGKLPGFGRVVSGFNPACPYCGAATLTLYRCGNCGEFALAATLGDDLRFRLVRPFSYGGTVDEPESAGGVRLMTPTAWPGAEGHKAVYLDSKTADLVGRFQADVTLHDFTEAGTCPNCGEEHSAKSQTYRPFSPPPSLVMSVLTETMLACLPEYASPDRVFMPARGRRLLAFTDGRQGAARLGPRLTNQHEVQVLRSAIVGLLQPVIPQVIAFYQQRVDELKGQLANGGLPAEMQDILAQDLVTTEAKLITARTGKPALSLATELTRSPQAAELLDRDGGENHEAPWTRAQWNENLAAVCKDLPRRVKAELARPVRGTRVGGLESLGLVEVAYPGLESATVPAALEGEYAPVARVWKSLLTVLCDTLRYDGAVTLGTDAEDDSYDFGGVRIGKFQNRASFVGQQARQRRRSLVLHLLTQWNVPAEERPGLADRILGEAFDALRRCAATEGAPPQQPAALTWLQGGTGEDAGAIRINFNHLSVRRPAQLYHSPRTGHVFANAIPVVQVEGQTIYAVPEAGCTDLRLTNHAAMDAHARVGRRRRELQAAGAAAAAERGPEIDFFRTGLWAEEHTAQLSPEENRRLQDLFKAGARNVLSSTTTLELGIDIGGLSCVFMTDVPPGKANYLQRAGRAGRRADGSSLVVTYARQKPFDRQVFARFDTYLDTPLRDPTVFLERRRIVERHANAFLLGEFFRDLYPPGAHVGAMQAYMLIGQFCGVALPQWWGDEPERPAPRPGRPDAGRLYHRFGEFLEKAIADQGHELRTRLVRLVRGCDGLPLGEPASQPVTDFLRGVHPRLMNDAIRPWLADYEELLQAWEQAAGQKITANAIAKSCEAMYELTTIEALADAQFLPRYGFPIGVLPLRVFSAEPDRKGRLRVREEDQYRLERPGLLALREYTPGQTVVAGGKAIRSRGLLKHWTGADLDNAIGMRGRAATCGNGHFHYRRDGQNPQECPVCGEAPRAGIKDLLFPKHGFSTAWWDPPRRTGDSEIVGSVQLDTTAFVEGADDMRSEDFGAVRGLTLRYRDGGRLLVYNPGYADPADANQPEGADGQNVPPRRGGCGFAICTLCGYAEAENNPRQQGIQGLPAGFEQHKPLRRAAGGGNARCWRKDLSPVLRNQVLAAEQPTDIVLLDLSPWTGRIDVALAQTLAVALRLGGARLLRLDSRELGSMIVPAGEQGRSLGIVVYDNHPGGAGHVLELAKTGRGWLEMTRTEVLFVDGPHHARCKSACLDCLLTFDAVALGPGNELQRPAAYQFLSDLLRANPQPDEGGGADDLAAGAEEAAAPRAAAARGGAVSLRALNIEAADPRVHAILQACPLTRQPVPQFIFITDAGDYRTATAELAWTRQKIAVLTPEQAEWTGDFQRAGWTVRIVADDPAQLGTLIEELRDLLNWGPGQAGDPG